jgi:IclR family acetate operon transcriptional repressor
LVHTLTGSGLLARTGEGRYVIGVRIGTLAAAFNRQMAPAEHLAPRVRELARTTGETAYAAGWQDGDVVVLTVARGDNPVQASDVRPGTAEDGHARASGKLLLAYATEDERRDYLDRNPLRRRTANTITDRRRFELEMTRIREAGYAIDDEEFAEGLSCIAVPLDGGASPFVFGLSAPSDRFRIERDRYLETALQDAEERPPVLQT